MLSAGELAEQVNHWCDQNGVAPASGQAGDRMTERNIRYYRTLGLLDPPLAGGGRGFGEKHLAQLIALRLLQAQGLPLSRIRELLFGRSLDELKRIETEGLREWRSPAVAGFRPLPRESWGVTPLNEEFLLISRRGQTLSQELRARLLAALDGAAGDGRAAEGPNERNHYE